MFEGLINFHDKKLPQSVRLGEVLENSDSDKNKKASFLSTLIYERQFIRQFFKLNLFLLRKQLDPANVNSKCF